MCPSSGEKLLYLCDTGTCHSVWVASGLQVRFSIYLFISLLYMFRASMAHHQEKIAVSMRHWYLSRCTSGVWSAGWIFNIFIYFSSLHVSGNHGSSSGENFCIHANLVLVTLYGWRLVCWFWISNQPADQTPPIQSDKYQCRIDTVNFS